MCGIVGYVGSRNTIEVLLNGLTSLEYRGYDSSGISVYDKVDKDVKIFKAPGKLDNLKEILKNDKTLKEAGIGIGHIRWATHGIPSLVNAHPHTCNCGSLVIVHNGIIENYLELKNKLEALGCKFKSQTDTETIAHLIAQKYKEEQNLTTAVRKAVKELKGAYALCVMHKNQPDLIVAARKNAPLLIGVGENENFVASDIPATIAYTKHACYLNDDEIATVWANKFEVCDLDGKIINKRVELLPWESQTINKMGYKHFMLKEIHEQPDVIRNVLSNKLIDTESKINLEEVKLTSETIKNLSRIEIIACGTSLHAAMVGKYIIESMTKISVDVEASSEYIYREKTTNKNTLVIGVSQSGETADTITAIRQAKATGAHILIITNRPDSTMAREAHSLVSVNAGIEVSVAATKSYIAQVLSFYLFAIYLSEIKGTVSNEELKNLKFELLKLPNLVETILQHEDEIKKCASKYASTKDFIYISRGINLASAYEGALKLKEISYINATGYPAGELKHGPIAMLDETMPVMVILMPGVVYEKTLSNAQEAKARHAKLIALTSSDDPKLYDTFDDIIKIPSICEMLSPALTCVPLQLFAYYIAEFLGKDVDQPRNLAKSVTVE